MLVEFTVGNYRSIKDPVTLSAVATKQRKTAATGKRRPGVVPDEEIAPAYQVEGRGFGLLPVLGIFGANASGKSNVLRALDDCLTLATDVSISPERVPLVPHLLQESPTDEPISFQIEVVAQDYLYAYSLQLKNGQIFHERLSSILPFAKRPHLLYDRRWDETDSKFLWRNGEYFRGNDLKMKAQSAPGQTFLSLLIHGSSSEIIQPFTEWLKLRFPGIGLNNIDQDYAFVVRVLGDERREYLERVSRFVRLFDTGVQAIEIRKPTEGTGQYDVLARHDFQDEIRLFSMGLESAGTKRLFTLAFQVIFTLETGTLLVVDELEYNLHPYITHALVKMFQDPDINSKRAQLIFSSHDNTLLRNNLLRRDQVWFTEKRRNQTTDLYPLSDYQLRNDRLIDLGYLHGRFGAVPVLPADYDLGELLEVGRK